MRNREKLRERVFQPFLVVNVIYIVFAAIVLICCRTIVSAMVLEQVTEVARYLALETIGF
jgi:hypothetical protein